MKQNEKIGVMLMATILVLSLSTFVISSVLASAGTTVGIDNASADPDATTTTAITAYDVENLGNFGIAVIFDPDVVNVTDVTGNPDVGNFLWERITDERVDLYTLNFVNIPSLSGDVLLATLALHAVGTRDEDIPPTIDFISPTPENDSTNTTGSVNVTVNVTDSSGVSTVLLNWNGENETMLYMIGNDTWSANKTGLSSGDYTYKVYANDTAGKTSPLGIEIGQLFDNESDPIPATPVNGTFTIPGNMGESETRVVTVMTWPRIGDMNGDESVDFDDVILLARHIYFGDPVSDDPDVNGDGSVDFDDVILLARHIYFGDEIYP